MQIGENVVDTVISVRGSSQICMSRNKNDQCGMAMTAIVPTDN
jgi:hypothetical protein